MTKSACPCQYPHCVDDGSYLDSITYNIGVTNNNGQDYIQCSLYLSQPNGLPTGSTITESNKVPVSSLVSSPYPYVMQEVNFKFDDTVLLQNGLSYVMVIKTGNDLYPDATDNIAVQVTSDQDTQHINGVNSGSSWSQTGLAQIFTLYGYIPNQLIVSYNANIPSDIVNFTGQVPIDNNRYADGQLVIVQGNTGGLASDNYIFLGWANTDNAAVPSFVVDKNNAVHPPNFSIGATSVTLYAVWAPITQNVTFGTFIFRQYDLQGGSINHDLNVELLFEVNSTVLFSVTGLAENYKFMGWLQNGTMFSTAQNYNYIVQSEDTFVITAIFYDPLSKGSLEDLDLMAVLAIALCAILIAFVLFAILWVRGRRQNYEDE